MNLEQIQKFLNEELEKLNTVEKISEKKLKQHKEYIQTIVLNGKDLHKYKNIIDKYKNKNVKSELYRLIQFFRFYIKTK